LAFNAESERIEYGSYTVVIDHQDRKVRVFTDLDSPELGSDRDWSEVQAKLGELGVGTLDEVPGEGGERVLVAEGSF
jgi:hypothetical protein